jgi:hypothetical protein
MTHVLITSFGVMHLFCKLSGSSKADQGVQNSMPFHRFQTQQASSQNNARARARFAFYAYLHLVADLYPSRSFYAEETFNSSINLKKETCH